MTRKIEEAGLHTEPQDLTRQTLEKSGKVACTDLPKKTKKKKRRKAKSQIPRLGGTHMKSPSSLSLRKLRRSLVSVQAIADCLEVL